MLKCVPHVQHDYFSSFNQSDHCFLALSLPLPSSLVKLSVDSFRTAVKCTKIKKHTCKVCKLKLLFFIAKYANL